MLKNLFKMFNESNELNNSPIELNTLKNRLSILEQKSIQIQEKFNFYLPDYIIDEIIESEETKSFVTLHYLINCAVVNERISKNNAKLLKQVYSFK